MARLLQFGNLIIDLEGYDVAVAGQRVELTFLEFQLLAHLALNAGRVISRRELLSSVWSHQPTDDSGKLNILISRLRKKLAGSDPWAIHTVPRRGYVFRNDGPPQVNGTRRPSAAVVDGPSPSLAGH